MEWKVGLECWSVAWTFVLLFGHRVAQEVCQMKLFYFHDLTLRNGSYERHIWCHTYNLVWVTVRPWTPCYALVDGELKGIHLYSKCIVRYGNLVLQNLRGSFNITCSFFNFYKWNILVNILLRQETIERHAAWSGHILQGVEDSWLLIKNSVKSEGDYVCMYLQMGTMSLCV